MSNAPTFTFAQLLGRAPQPAPPEATPAKVAAGTALLPDGRLPQVAAGNKFSHVLRHHEKAVKATSQKPRTQTSKAAATTPAKTSRASAKVTTSRPAAKAPQFGHLAPDRIPAYGQDAAEAPAADRDRYPAAAILAAAAKARTPTGANLPAPTGFAAQVLAAAEKARTPTKAAPLPDDPVVRGIIAAGRKRRGETS